VRGAFDNPLIQELSTKVIMYCVFLRHVSCVIVLQRCCSNFDQVVFTTRVSDLIDICPYSYLTPPRFVPLPKSSQPERIISNGQVFGWDIEPTDMAKLDALDRGKDGAVTWNPVDVD
jgi:hypothetical protein